MIDFPPAKINLGLHILHKRADGYHDIETVLYPVNWCDALEAIKDNTLEGCLLEAGGIALNIDMHENLCVKAYQLLNKDFKLPGIRFYLQKAIPHGAGLGGGSSDAATAFRLLNDVCALKLPDEVLADYAAALGSDVPFFIYNKPALATGRGEKILPVNISLKGYYISIVKPDINISTAMAYSMSTPCRPDLPLESVIMLPVNNWKHVLVNDFESPVFKLFPLIKEIKSDLYRKGALYASLSGSGSSVYCISDHPIDLSDFYSLQTWTGRC